MCNIHPGQNNNDIGRPNLIIERHRKLSVGLDMEGIMPGNAEVVPIKQRCTVKPIFSTLDGIE